MRHFYAELLECTGVLRLQRVSAGGLSETKLLLSVTYLARSGPSVSVLSDLCDQVRKEKKSQENTSLSDTALKFCGGGQCSLLVRIVAGVSHSAWGAYLKGVVISLMTLIGLHTTSWGIQNDLSLNLFTSPPGDKQIHPYIPGVTAMWCVFFHAH